MEEQTGIPVDRLKFDNLAPSLSEQIKTLGVRFYGAVALISIPPTWSVGKVVGVIKANTARGLKTKFSFLKEVYWGTDSIWSDGYFVSTVGMDADVIQRYIENQGQEDSGQAQLELG